MKLESLEAEFAIHHDDLLVNDESVKVLPSLSDREAMINHILADDRRKIDVLRIELKNNGHIEKVVRMRHKELDNTMSAIRLQRSLLRDQLRTGSFYGDESPEARDEIDDLAGVDIDSMLNEAEAEIDSEAIGLVEGIDDEELNSALDVLVETTATSTGEEESEEEESEEEDSEEDDFGFGDLDEEDTSSTSVEDVLQAELDAVVEEGGVDDTPPPQPITTKKSKKMGETLKVEPPLKEGDVDDEMEDFLDQDFDSLLDQL